MIDVAALRTAIGRVEDPEIHRSLEELNMLRDIDVEDNGRIRVVVALTIPGCPLKDTLTNDVTAAAKTVDGVGDVTVEFTTMTDEERSNLVADVRGDKSVEIPIARPGSKTRIIAVSSGKGGVGKSSVTTNLAVALAAAGNTVGVMDADVWGFSIPRMLGVDRPPTVIEETLFPPEAHGVKAMSMDFFVPDDQAVIWRGPMLHQALEQFLSDVHWDDPDFLLIDMPPGTGDISISISQFLPMAQTLIVTTPQITAQRVAKRAGLMALKVDQEIIGVVENMAWFTGDDGKQYQIFGEGGGAALAEELDVPLLGQIPLVPEVRASADDGEPIVVAAPDSEAALIFVAIAEEIIKRKPRRRSHPQLVIN